MSEQLMLEEKKTKTCFFTGHRDIPRSDYMKIQEKLEPLVRQLIEEQGVEYFGVGGALGFDTIAAATVVKLKREYSKIRLVIVLPYHEYEANWPKEDKDLFKKITNSADKVVYIAKKYYHGCTYKRNRHLADYSAWGICFVERPTGGAAYTYNYAKSLGVTLYNLAMDG